MYLYLREPAAAAFFIMRWRAKLRVVALPSELKPFSSLLDTSLSLSLSSHSPPKYTYHHHYCFLLINFLLLLETDTERDLKVSMSALVEEKMLLSPLLASELCSQTPQGTEQTRARRRRKKMRADGDSKKRRLSEEQVRFLEMSFGKERKLESGRKVHLAAELGLDPKQVAVWFQNRRARHKSKQVEEAYLKLKSLHDAAVLQKCHLENEVLKLKEQLREADEEIRKLSVVASGGGGIKGFGATSVPNNGAGTDAERNSGSPASSFSTVTHQPMGYVEFGVAEGEADYGHRHSHLMMSYVQEYYYGDYYMMELESPNIYDM